MKDNSKPYVVGVTENTKEIVPYKTEKDKHGNLDNFSLEQKPAVLAIGFFSAHTGGVSAENVKKFEKLMPDILQDLINGCTFKDIAIKYDFTINMMYKLKNLPEFKISIEQALEYSADYMAEEGLKTLLDAEGEENMAEVKRVEATAKYYQWLAEKRNPKVYGKNVGSEKNSKPKPEDDSGDSVAPKQEVSFEDALAAIMLKKQMDEENKKKGFQDAEIVDEDNK